MRKSFLFLSVLLTMVSCHHVKPVDSPAMESEGADSTAVVQDSLAIADGVEVASGEMFSEDYLYGWIVRVYDKVNEVWSRQEVHQEELDTAFFAKSYLDLKARVQKAEEGKDFDHLFFIEYMPFSQGLRAPIRLNTVKVNLLTGNIAEINYDISDPDGNEVKMWLHLTFENGQWRIDDFNNYPEEPETYVDRMENYLQGNK